MPSNLKDLIERQERSIDRVLRRSETNYDNQRSRESNLRRGVKKGLVYGSLISVLALGAYGCHHYYNKYQSYVTEQNNKMVYYQKKFDPVKYYYNKKRYLKADELSEKLQDELDAEWFFSPINKLYEKVKEYDDKIIDPQVKRIKRERLNGEICQISDDLRERWEDATIQEKGVAAAVGTILSVIICKILFGKKKDEENKEG
ncbi:MAG: hypothetical protein ISS23_02305 [Nanoarchaeota archaeon]|nr:hypothetical protein [Nanoarchaeota archaeon]